VPIQCSALSFSHCYQDTISRVKNSSIGLPENTNPLWEYFQNHKEGHGIFKWEHYFEVYDRHLSKFVGRGPNILEVGIYSGGSLEMWRSYFGENSHIYGVDIEQACKAYESKNISVYIGDQANRNFWKSLKESVQSIDILIDDGGHTVEQQLVTLEEMLPHLRAGGVYVCEDIHGRHNRFAAFAAELVNELNQMNIVPGSVLQSAASQFQSAIHSIHFYPYLLVIEKHDVARTKLLAPRRGTKWQPFPLL
jgi:hypothetical protein